MYLDHFNLREEPFRLTPDPKFLYLSKMHSKARTYLDFAICNRDGFAVITGEIGSGKTTVLNSVISTLPDDVILAKIHQTQLDESELLHSILYEFEIETNDKIKVNHINLLNNYLLSQYKNNKKVLLVIDEAQNLSATALEELRLLSGLEIDNAKLINIILVGQPNLREKLDSCELEQLTQRIRLRYHLKALQEDELKDYILHRLRQAGANDLSLFNKDVFPLIYRYTGGIPRLINVLCDTSLIVAYADNLQSVTLSVVKEAIKELQWVTYRRRKEKMRQKSMESNKTNNNKTKKDAHASIPLDIDLANY